MQKTVWTIFLVALIAVVIFILFFMAYKSVHKAPQAEPEYSGMHRVLALDYDESNELDQDELLKGEDAVLAVKTTGADQMFNSVAALENLDSNKDHRLDKNDKLFSQLELIFFINNGKGKKIVSLEKAGITAIIFDKNNLQQLKNYKGKTIPVTEDIIIGDALTSKGKLLHIKLIPVGIPNN